MPAHAYSSTLEATTARLHIEAASIARAGSVECKKTPL